MTSKNIVCIGGGNGPAIALQALKPFLGQVRAQAVVAMTDSGGSSGKLRKEMGVLPPSDIMRALLALSAYDHPLLRKIFYEVRFRNADVLTGHSLGNIFLSFTEEKTGSILPGLKALAQALEIKGDVFPVTLDKADLVAELSSGQKITGEGNIDEPTYDRKWRIRKVWLEPTVELYAPAQTCIENAAYILLGPGSLYTSIIAALAVPGMREALTRSKAKLVGISNHFYATNKETGPTRLSERVQELEMYLPRPLDVILYDTYTPTPAETKHYSETGWVLLPKDVENIRDRKCIAADIIQHGGGMSPQKLSQALKKYIF